MWGRVRGEKEEEEGRSEQGFATGRKKKKNTKKAQEKTRQDQRRKPQMFKTTDVFRRLNKSVRKLPKIYIHTHKYTT